MMTIGEKVKELEKFFNVERPDDINFRTWVDVLNDMEEGYKKKNGKYPLTNKED